MGDNGSGDGVRHVVWVPVPWDEAFQAFTAGITAWWPVEHTFGRDEVRSIVIEPRHGGRWLERDAGGRERDWGRVLVWEPPQRVVLTWQITYEGRSEPDPERASVVEFEFTPDGNGTRIELEHREFERHGAAGAEIWRAGMASLDGWPKIIGRFVDAVT